MKNSLKYVFFLFIVIVIVFFSLGFFIPVISFQNKVLVNKPIDLSFETFTDVSKMKDWFAGFKNIEWLSGFPGEIGNQWALTVVQNGKEYIMIQTITGFKVNELFAFHLENKILDSDVQIYFSSKNNITEITVDNKIEGKNIYWKSLFVFTQLYFKNKQQENYERLKQVIESN